MRPYKVISYTVVIVVGVVGMLAITNLQEFVPAEIEGFVGTTDVFNLMMIGVLVTVAVVSLSLVLKSLRSSIGIASSDDWEPSTPQYTYIPPEEEKETRFLDCTVCGAPNTQEASRCQYCGRAIEVKERAV